MKLMKVLFVAAIAIAIAAPSFAAVQNIKVSGSIEERAIANEDFDLKNEGLDSTAVTNGVVGTGASVHADDDSFIISTVKVGIDSDLTDNVSASITLANQTRWGDAAADIDLNKAYITMKEFFYQPLTVRIGRQPLLYGQGLIVGPGLFGDPNGAFVQPTETQWDPIGVANVLAVPISGAQGREYSISNNFDAIRTTIDLDPWTLDSVFALINETDTASDDEFLTGLNVTYKFDQYNAQAEGYYFFNKDESFNSRLGYVRQATITGGIGNNDTGVTGIGNRLYEENIVHVLGARGDIEPVQNLTLSAEGAFQFGELIDHNGPWNASTNGSDLERDREAWAADVSGNYTWKESVYKPSLGLGYVYLSGEEADNGGDFEAWDPMFKSKMFSSIRDHLYGDQLDWSGFGGALYQTVDENDTAGNTNSHILWVGGGLKPLEDLTINTKYLHFWFDERPLANRSTTAGDEVDCSVVYDYTEDVQLEATGAWFIPGNYYEEAAEVSAATSFSDQRSDDLASSITAAVRVAF